MKLVDNMMRVAMYMLWQRPNTQLADQNSLDEELVRDVGSKRRNYMAYNVLHDDGQQFFFMNALFFPMMIPSCLPRGLPRRIGFAPGKTCANYLPWTAFV